MKLAALLALVSGTVLASPSAADPGSVLGELSRVEGIDFQVTGVLTAGDYMGQDYQLFVPELGNLPAIIDGGRDLRKQIEDNCLSARGCDVSVTGRLEFELPIVTFSIGSASSISSRQAAASPQNDFAACWNVGVLSSKDLNESVTIAFEVKDGYPEAGTIRYVSGSKPETEITGLFESARRAVILCGAKGTSLPDGTAEVTFDAREMALR